MKKWLIAGLILLLIAIVMYFRSGNSAHDDAPKDNVGVAAGEGVPPESMDDEEDLSRPQNASRLDRPGIIDPAAKKSPPRERSTQQYNPPMQDPRAMMTPPRQVQERPAYEKPVPARVLHERPQVGKTAPERPGEDPSQDGLMTDDRQTNEKDDSQEAQSPDGMSRDDLTDQPEIRGKRSEKIPANEDQGLD